MVRFALSKRMAVALAVLVVVIVVMASVLLVANKPAAEINGIMLDNSTLREGDLFVYDLGGIYNGTQISGTINSKYQSPSSFEYNTSFSDPEFGFIFRNSTSFNLLGGGIQVGVGMFSTHFGIKGVVWTFDSHGIWASISYVGTNPGISYAMSINGPDTHLILTLVSTTSKSTLDNNTQHLSLNPRQVPIGANEGGIGGLDKVAGTAGETFFTEKGGVLNYSLDATDVDIIAFSEGNMRSMAENGPFAYDLAFSKKHASVMTGELIIPAGYYSIIFSGKNQSAEQAQGVFHWTLTRY